MSWFEVLGVSDIMTHNGERLGEGGAFEAQIFNFAQKFNRRTTVELCSFAPLLQNPCYLLALFCIMICSFSLVLPIASLVPFFWQEKGH